MRIIDQISSRFPPFILLMALLAAFPPLATDMYLPALPLLQREWQVPLVTINLTLVIFFMTYCVFLLVYGPLSDRYGRRPPLLIGVSVFIFACLGCALAQNAGMMVWGRFLQGAGAAAASAIVLAICKDRFSGPQRQRIFIQIGVIVAAAPMIAPVLGGWIIQLLSWRWIFLLQALLAFCALIGVWRMEESLRERSPSGCREVGMSYLRLLRNRRYISLMLTLSLTGIPVFAFIGGSADLYITRFGYDERQFGYFFGFNALAFVLAPLTFSRLVRRFATMRLLPFGFMGMLCSSLLLLVPILPSPWGLTLPMFLLTFSFSFCRPAGNNLILEQVNRDSGAASSLMVFVFFSIGALSMWSFSLEWGGRDKIILLGQMGAASVTCTLVLWQVIKGRLRTGA
ncbi:multidrug effflux MFS transporter [Desulfobulbus alkaliphilus]|uniref:multidrug effflux MFS transporter n=1 Tax=Desulfobulbus alkaliphilus TaxID=869814 RepID=UPI001965A131|nr:multidrug effflux MFS transporter [Desulfobulbus alkaliphilus]MBM9536018.1 multidrug effflux MFS transporter [Desulfobulbus alkaliphilus]